MLRSLWVICCLAPALAAMAGAPARAQEPVYYHITGVTVEQLSNAVRVKLEADGTITPTIYWWAGEPLLDYYLDSKKAQEQTTEHWSPDVYPPRDRIRLHLYSALPQVGSVTNVGKYPVSHIRLMLAREQAPNRYGLDVEVVLQKKMRMRQFQFTNRESWGWDAYLYDHHDPAWFTIFLSPDQRSLIITVASDRLPDPPRHRSLRDVPEQQRELSVHASDGLLTVHARNVALSEVAEAVTRESGIQVAAGEGAATRLINAEVPSIAPAEFASRLADCYGLVLSSGPGRIVLSDAAGQAAASQGAIEQRAIRVQHLRAVAAAGLLPDFLLDYLRVDEEGNALLVSGPEALADKVASDVAKIDQAPTAVCLRARVVESSSSEETARQLALRYAHGGRQLATDPGAGQIVYFAADTLPDDFEAKLRALITTGQATMQSDASLVVLSGESGEIFSGQDKYVVLYRRLWDAVPSLQPVTTGVSLLATPLAGNEFVTVDVTAEVRSIDGIDPLTGMPVVNTRSASGVFRLRPGDTVAIGGLSQAQEYWVRRRLPVLGSLPLVGRLFRWKTRQRTTSELLVLLTPAIEESRSRTVEEPARGGQVGGNGGTAEGQTSRLEGDRSEPAGGRRNAPPSVERTWQGTSPTPAH
jgi:type II secretory pathway component GspD/PulD (secretin)